MWDSAFDSVGVGQPGGGFLNNTSNFPSPSKGTEDRRRGDRITNIVPCTVAQILQVPEAEEHLKIGQLSAHIITIVGSVLAVDHQSTKITYLIDDMTGKPIEAQLWTANDESNAEVLYITQNTYVRVTGALRTMRGKRHIIVFKIKRITDLNELTMHLLEVIHTSMSATVMSNQHASTSNIHTSGNTVSAATSFTDAAANMDVPMYGLSRSQQMVLQAIVACKDQQGANIHRVIDSLKSLSKKVIMDAVEFLSNEGHIYSTVDDDHYKSTVSE